jgi:hypothetical protein
MAAHVVVLTDRQLLALALEYERRCGRTGVHLDQEQLSRALEEARAAAAAAGLLPALKGGA